MKNNHVLRSVDDPEAGRRCLLHSETVLGSVCIIPEHGDRQRCAPADPWRHGYSRQLPRTITDCLDTVPPSSQAGSSPAREVLGRGSGVGAQVGDGVGA
jgi:hypothetical protein